MVISRLKCGHLSTLYTHVWFFLLTGCCESLYTHCWTCIQKILCFRRCWVHVHCVQPPLLWEKTRGFSDRLVSLEPSGIPPFKEISIFSWGGSLVVFLSFFLYWCITWVIRPQPGLRSPLLFSLPLLYVRQHIQLTAIGQKKACSHSLAITRDRHR